MVRVLGDVTSQFRIPPVHARVAQIHGAVPDREPVAIIERPVELGEPTNRAHHLPRVSREILVIGDQHALSAQHVAEPTNIAGITPLLERAQLLRRIGGERALELPRDVLVERFARRQPIALTREPEPRNQPRHRLAQAEHHRRPGQRGG